MERVGELRTLISSALLHQDHTYSLSAMGKPLTDETVTLAAAGLVRRTVDSRIRAPLETRDLGQCSLAGIARWPHFRK